MEFGKNKHGTADPDPDLPSPAPPPGRMSTPRSRGAVTGVLLVLLGLWGAIVGFVGPSFDFGYTPNESFEWTEGRFWMQLLPGVVAAACGLALLTTRNRAVGVLAGYLGATAGAWFVVGPVLAVEELGSWSAIGTPLGDETQRTVEKLTMFYGLGVAIAFLAALAVGRMTVRSASELSALAAVREHEADLREQQAAVREQEAAGREQDATVREQDATVREQDAATLEQDALTSEQDEGLDIGRTKEPAPVEDRPRRSWTKPGRHAETPAEAPAETPAEHDDPVETAPPEPSEPGRRDKDAPPL